jgi:ribosomal RNA-processing protein 7
MSFLPLPVSIQSPSSSSSSTHHLWIKPHSSSSTPDFPPKRTLFVANLPVDTTEESLRQLFLPYGPIERVEIKREAGMGTWLDGSDSEGEDDDDDEVDVDEEEVTVPVTAKQSKQPVPPSSNSNAKQTRRKSRTKSKPTLTLLPSLYPRSTPYLSPGSAGFIVYLSPLSLERAVSSAQSSSEKKAVVLRSDETTGLGYYAQQHALLRPSFSAIKAHADSSLEAYDAHLLHLRSKKAAEPQVDEDGFTLVTRSGSSGSHGRSAKGAAGVGVASRQFVLAAKRAVAAGSEVDARDGLMRGKKKKGAVLGDGFYRFQRGEKRKQGMSILVILYAYRCAHEPSFMYLILLVIQK